MAFREIEITPQALLAGRHAGLAGDIAARLKRMVRRAAPATHERGNRRFNEFVLDIQDGRLVDVTRISA